MGRIILLIFISTSILQAQPSLEFSSKYFSVHLPSDWHHARSDTFNSIIHSVYFNSDSTELLEIFSIKINSNVVLDNLVKAVTSEKKLFGDFGQLVETKKTKINNVDAIENIYAQHRKRLPSIHTNVSMFCKKKLGYVMVFRAFKDLKNVQSLPAIQSSFVIKIPRTSDDWVKIAIFMGVCVVGLVLGMQKLIAWLRPLQWKAIYYCAALVLLSLACLAVFYYAIDKIGYWIAAIISLGLIVAMTKIPKVEVVENAFKEAKRKNTASSYREFCENYGAAIRYCKQARQRIRELMDSVVKKYRELIRTNDNPLSRAILAMFEYVKETDNFQVEISYKNQNMIIDNLTVSIESKPVKLVPVASAFTEQKNKMREYRITNVIRQAFRTITPEDILSFTDEGTSKTKGINFSIRYLIANSGAIYSHESEKDLPIEKRTLYAGVDFSWNIEIRIPKHTDTFSFQFQSKPAPHFTSQGMEIDKVYDAMADSAFDDFCRVFIQQSGFKANMMAS